MASEKVRSAFGYHAAPRGVMAWCAAMSCAHGVTRENRPRSAGVVRRMARSDYWRWVSTPRWARVSCCDQSNHRPRRARPKTVGWAHWRRCARPIQSSPRSPLCSRASTWSKPARLHPLRSSHRTRRATESHRRWRSLRTALLVFRHRRLAHLRTLRAPQLTLERAHEIFHAEPIFRI